MGAINIHEAKSHLSELLDRALAGEDIVVARAGRPLARLVPVESRTPRRPGIAKGRVTDAFFEPLPEEELAAWEGALRVLLDTHALLWWFFDDPRLSDAAREAIAEPDALVLVSAASGWEITTKHRLGKLPEAGDVPTRLPHYVRKARFSVLSVSLEHAIAAGALPGPHRDPFDRMLMAQARHESVPVVTVDPVFAQYGVPVVW